MSATKSFLPPLQATVTRKGSCAGIGIHSGQSVNVQITPAPADSGIVFVRTDGQKSGARSIAATWKNVVDTRFSTTLGNSDGPADNAGGHPDDGRISTVEHLMAAFWALGIHNATVEVAGAELPIFDGSSQPWISLLTSLGRTFQPKRVGVHKVTKTLRVEEGDSWLQVDPCDTFRVDVTAPLGHGAQAQTFSYRLGDVFNERIGSARTFSLRENVEKMRALGLIQGGSLDNAVVLDQGRVMNPEGLRFPNECARHKVLDLIGDWALGGPLILGHVRAYAPGHTLNHRLLRLVMADAQPEAQPEAAETEGHQPMLRNRRSGVSFTPPHQACAL